MAKSETEKRKRAERTREFLGRLAERYPGCFTRDPKAVRPLAIGIQNAIRDELAKDPEWQDTPNWLIRQALALYTRSVAYHTAVDEKRPRIDLHGNEVGEVSEAEQSHAREQLEQIRKRRAELKPKKPAKQAKPGKPRTPRPAKKKSADAEKQGDGQPSLSKLELLAQKFAKH